MGTWQTVDCLLDWRDQLPISFTSNPSFTERVTHPGVTLEPRVLRALLLGEWLVWTEVGITKGMKNEKVHYVLVLDHKPSRTWVKRRSGSPQILNTTQ